jgi:periplasmic protein TonB
MSLFDEIVFAQRNKKYGAYQLRRRYKWHLLIACIISLVLFAGYILYSKYDISLKSSMVYQLLNDSSGVIEFTNFDLAPVPVEPKNNPRVSGVDETAVEVAKVTNDELGFEETKTEELMEQMMKTFREDISEDLAKDIEQSTLQHDAAHSNSSLNDVNSPIKAMETELRRYILQNTKYPDSALNKKINGLVLVQFILTSKGDITNISLLKNANPILDREALRVVKSIPHNRPVVIKGKPVMVMYKIPIVFKYNQ